MAEIKAIETIYNGYRFRSRLEARWAVFFDKANIKYEYELEGFKTKDGTCYLPDFYLPEYNIYVEVKPEHEIVFGQDENTDRVLKNEKDENKIRKFASEILKLGESLFVTGGDPYNVLQNWGIVLTKAVCVKVLVKALEVEDIEVKNCGDCKKCNATFNVIMRGLLMPKTIFKKHDEMIFSEDKTLNYILCGNWDRHEAMIPMIQNFAYKPDNFEVSDLQNDAFSVFHDAALHARQARFEHGEKG